MLDHKAIATFCSIALGTALAGCDEQIATINDANALRVASCALSPFELNDLGALFALMQSQQQGACAGGGLINRSDTATSTMVTADHCVTAENTTLRGTFISTDINDNPVEIDLNLAQVSSVDSFGTGARFDGEVTLMQAVTTDALSQIISFERLLKDEIQDNSVDQFIFGPTVHTVVESQADLSSTIEFSSRIEQCGGDLFGLTVDTPVALFYMSSSTSLSDGEIRALADDGTSLTINFSDDNLVINLDSNADQVQDTRLSMTWNEFQGAVELASRQREEQPLLNTPIIKMWSR